MNPLPPDLRNFLARIVQAARGDAETGARRVLKALAVDPSADGGPGAAPAGAAHLFVRWKPLAEQPVGWTPDSNDGVRLNLRPFLSAELARGGRAGAGVLRWKPNVAWGKDRGKEPTTLRLRDDSPSFWSCPGSGTINERIDFRGGEVFDGNRWNDMHYTNAVKRAARAAANSRKPAYAASLDV